MEGMIYSNGTMDFYFIHFDGRVYQMGKKKRNFTTLLAAVMLLCALVPVSALANVQHRYVYTSNGAALNLRKAPVTHANNKIADIPYGAEVLVESYVNNNTWAYVSYQNKTGYVMTRYLVKQKPEARKPATNAADTAAEVNYSGFKPARYDALVRAHTPGGYVNLRWGPSKSVAVQSRICDGTVLRVIAQNTHWAQVEEPSTGAVGFMLRSFLNEQEAN